MFSDTYKVKLISEVMYEVYGKLETRKLGDGKLHLISLKPVEMLTKNQISVQLAGSNPSAEEADEGTEEAVESGVDIVLNHRLAETGFSDKKQFTVYLKDYMKK